MAIGLEWKIIEHDDDIKAFADGFLSRPGLIPIDQSWLLANTLVGVYQNGQIAGGFVHERYPYTRSLFEIEEGVRLDYLKPFFKSDITRAFSVSCFWISKKNPSVSLTFYTWSIMLKYLISVRETIDFVIFATNSNRLHGIYERIGMRKIYNMPSKTNPSNMAGIYLCEATWANAAKFGKFIVLWGSERLFNNLKLQNFRFSRK